MFIDTSVIVAILAAEDDADSFAERIERATVRCTSALVILEAAMVLSARLDIDPIDAGSQIETLLDEAQIVTVPGVASLQSLILVDGEGDRTVLRRQDDRLALQTLRVASEGRRDSRWRD